MCNIDNDWPHGRAIFYNPDKSFTVKINGEDQLEIEFTSKEASINDSFLHLVISLVFPEFSLSLLKLNGFDGV